MTLAHEALAREWPRLRSWLDEDAAGQLLLRHLAVSADDWQAVGRPDSELYRGNRLSSVQDWRSRTSPSLSSTEAAFLDASAALAAAEQAEVRARTELQARQHRRLRGALAGTALASCSPSSPGWSLSSRGSGRRGQRGRRWSTGWSRRVPPCARPAGTWRPCWRSRPTGSGRPPRQRGRCSASSPPRRASSASLPRTPTAAPCPWAPAASSLVARPCWRSESTEWPRLLDLGSGRVLGRFPAPALPPIDARMDLSRDGRTLAVVSWEGPERGGGRATLSVYDMQTPQPAHRHPTAAGRRRRGGEPRRPVHRGLGYDDGHVLVFDTAGRSQLPELLTVTSRAPGVRLLPTVGSAPAFTEHRHTAALAFLPDGTLLAGSEVGIVRVVDPRDGAGGPAAHRRPTPHEQQHVRLVARRLRGGLDRVGRRGALGPGAWRRRVGRQRP